MQQYKYINTYETDIEEISEKVAKFTNVRKIKNYVEYKDSQ